VVDIARKEAKTKIKAEALYTVRMMKRMVSMSNEAGMGLWARTAVAAAMVIFAASATMQAQAPPVVSPATQDAQQAQAPAKQQEPSAPTPQGPIRVGVTPANPFPPVNLKNFTADSPSREVVNSFLKAIWGYDENRIWSVAAILKTPAPGVAEVVVFAADKANPGKDSRAVFFVTPDGKHAIAGDVIDFGAKPFEAARETLQARADGPAEGAAGKDLMLVEFAGLQCPRCQEAQDTMVNLAKDFPEARIVFEDLPMPDLHPYAYRAAAEGVCVRHAKGDAAFFKYAQVVYANQNQLTATGADAALAAAVTAAGGDPKAVMACAATPATKDTLKAAATLATDLGIDQTPILVVNGHSLPLAALPYETLKRIVVYQAVQDGIVVHVQPTLSTLK
jgi:protein-disulfide isomerase